MAFLSQLEKWFDAREKKIREDYFQFLRFRSISASPEYRKEVLACAEWLKNFLLKGGLFAELVETPGYPVVFAELKSAKPGAPTLLAYGHYDVQPVDPVELWQSNPFEPTVREGKIYARGASDDKGQIFYAVLAAIACKELGAILPAHLKFCIEGEEESQSLGLSKGIQALKDKFSSDFLLIVDFDSAEDGSAAITLGARGLASLEVVLTGSRTDLHSGVLGGIAYNPNRALVELLAGLWDAEGHVQVPGFYDKVREEDTSSYHFSQNRSHFTKEFGIEAFGGEKGTCLKEANWLRPTLEINGLVGGYTGVGIKTVIPKEARAKLTMRLVPDQDPVFILKALEAFLKKRAAKGMQVQIQSYGGEKAWRGRIDSPLVAALSLACEEVTHVPAYKRLCGASIPIIEALTRALDVEVAGMGYALPTDQIHAPNEHFDMERFKKGFLTFGATLMHLGKV